MLNQVFFLRKIASTFRFQNATFATLSKSFDVLIAGGGTGGITIANRLAGKLGNKNMKIGLIEPNPEHYYQPFWTLVGAGIRQLEESIKSTDYYIPDKVTWLKDTVKSFQPPENCVTLASGDKVSYKWLVISLGMKACYDKIKGAPEALASDPRVCSNYNVKYCQKTFPAFENFPASGTAIFTHPNTPVKCGGAPQKIMYLFDDYLRKKKKRAGVNIELVISLPGMFPVPKYSDSLASIAKSRGITTHHTSHLVEIKHQQSLAVIEKIGDGSRKEIKYDLLHVTPPFSAPDCIATNQDLADPTTKYVAVDPGTLRSTRFSNIFSLGDCASIPTSKTAAAVAGQSSVLAKNLLSLINGGPGDVAKYDGYTSCPLITGYDRGIMAEFGYENRILETLPFDQSKERFVLGWIKKNILHNLYWNAMLPGIWPGPKYLRKLFHLDFK